MRPRVVLVSYHRLTAAFRPVMAAVPPGVALEVVDVIFDAAVEFAREKERRGEVTVFLAGGANARLLRRHVQTPVVAIPVTGFAMLGAIRRAREFGPKVAVVSYHDEQWDLDDIAALTGMDVRHVTYGDVQEAAALMPVLREQGYCAVVGTTLICDIAQQHGMEGILIYSEEALRQALVTACEMAASLHREAAKREQLAAILDFASEGIIGVDADGVITAFNPAAERITGVAAAAAIGRRAAAVVPALRIAEILKSQSPALNQLESLGDLQVLTNRVPIVVGHSQVMGAVVTLQDVGTVQRAESKIRSELYSKGFVARHTFADIIGDSPAVQEMVRRARRYARSDSTVLLTGETGTGKEIIAQSMHNAGGRARGPFVALNCAALTESLLESELFGYEDGAFTGARRGGKPGVFELSHQGTIFLDEISEVSAALQARLLRVLQERQVLRVGGGRIIPVDVRVIAATNVDLRQTVCAGSFRADLYYRLNVLHLALPPLRERTGDLAPLFLHFVRRLAPDLASRLVAGAPDLAAILQGHTWPGNIRELENCAERLVTLVEPDAAAASLLGRLADLVADLGQGACPVSAPIAAPTPAVGPASLAEFAAEQQRDVILRVLDEVGGRRDEAARRLGISRTTLWRRLKEIG